METTTILIVIAILFFATSVRALFGFGDALIGMPLLTLAIGVQTATPLFALVSPIVATTMLLRDWRNLDLRATWRLVLATCIGIPIGLLFLKDAPEHIVKSILGIILIAFGLYNLMQLQLPTLRNQRLAYLFGFFAGILGGAYNTNGPPIIIYGMLARWSPDQFRTTLQGYFVPTGLIILISHGLAGLWTPHVLHLYVYALPFVLLAIFLGTRLSTRISPHHFTRLVYLFLLVIGIVLLT